MDGRIVTFAITVVAVVVGMIVAKKLNISV
jgi:hypothetical protein